jgi:hypothetical protein
LSLFYAFPISNKKEMHFFPWNLILEVIGLRTLLHLPPASDPRKYKKTGPRRQAADIARNPIPHASRPPPKMSRSTPIVRGPRKAAPKPKVE